MAKSKVVFYKTEEEIERLRAACLLNSKVLEYVASKIAPGVRGIDLDREAEELLRDNGAIPGFKGLYDFPNTLCISVNEQVVHGVPSDEPFKDGDIVSVDCGTILDEFYGDCAYTFALGDVNEETMQLLRVTNTALYLGIEKAVVGQRLGDIGYAIQHYCERVNGYGIVRELVGHGIGRNLHEAPEVPNYGQRGRGMKLKEGLSIAIEPMVNMGTKDVRTLSDDWTIVSKDLQPSAHFEHTVVVRKGKADILSTHKGVEAAILKNDYVREVAVLEMV
ncbi:MAG: type I methionyl aminopeptidase [Bacteroidota bacterium]